MFCLVAFVVRRDFATLRHSAACHTARPTKNGTTAAWSGVRWRGNAMAVSTRADSAMASGARRRQRRRGPTVTIGPTDVLTEVAPAARTIPPVLLATRAAMLGAAVSPSPERASLAAQH